MIEDKLRSRIGDKQVTCRLTLRPSGRVEGIKILESSGNPESDKKAIALLKGIASYGIDRDSHENLSYQVELPKLRLSPLKP